MSSAAVLLINAILFTLTLCYYLKKYKLSVGVLIWLLYTVSAWSSFLFVQQPGYATSLHASQQTLFPCIYLYVVFIIAMTPLMRLNKIENINYYNLRIVKAVMIITTVVFFLFVIIDLPVMTNVATVGTNALSQLRQTVYGDEGMSLVTANKWLNKLSLLFLGMRVLATGLSVITLVSLKDNRWLARLFFLACFLNNLRVILVQVGRGEIVFYFLLYASMFYLMREWLSPKQKRVLFMYAIPISAVGAIFFWAITISRFGNRAGFFMYKYLGEPINNFNGILFNNISGHTYGRAYFSLFYRYLLGQMDFSTGNEKWALIFNSTGVRGDIFYTWVGGIIIEFGKIAPFVVAIILNRIIHRMMSIKNYYYGDAIVLIFIINFFIRGVFLFPTQNFEGNLMIIYTIVLYLLFRLRRSDSGSIVFRTPKTRSKTLEKSKYAER